MENPVWDNRLIIHKILQVFGMAPYTVAETIRDSKLSKGLSVYNICLAILVVANLIYSETDPKNSGNYVNKTMVVDTAFDAVDWLGNFYVAISLLLSIVQYKSSRSVNFAIRTLEGKCVQMGVTIDVCKNRNYLLIKMIISVIATVVVMGLYIYFDGSSNYTVLYWICVLTPMAESSVVTLVFGSTCLNLYQKLWINNEFLRRIIDEYSNRLSDAKPKQILLNYEKSLEAIILKNNFFKKNLSDRVIRTKPWIVFVENFPQCFEKDEINILKELTLLREFHNDIIDTANLVNRLFGPHFLFLFSWYFLGVVINVYSIVTFHVVGEFQHEYGARVVLTINYLFMVSYLISCSNFTADEAKETMSIVLKFATKIDQNDDILKRECQHFILQLAHNPLEFTAAGFFRVNSGMLFSFAVGVITNVIFIVQFDKLNFQSPSD